MAALPGLDLPSDVVDGVVYRLGRRVGEGAMGVAFFALRIGPDGECPVVVKVMRPEYVRGLGPTAALIVKKEAIALGRLNERVPTTPFVVRFIDTGSVILRDGDATLELPWIALEYVHGGVEGTTLADRVAHSLRTSGHAFDTRRAAHAIECLTSGLSAVHEMGVIHRDVKPENVFCCGFGEGEIFKMADFGVARPVGMQGTFGGMIVGTLGYAAPELTTQDPRSIGTWSDVFSLACVVYFLLTGEDYFSVDTPAQALLASLSPIRRSIRDAPGLSLGIRERGAACRSIDFALAAATSGKIESRPQTAEAMAALLAPWFRSDARGPRSSAVVRLELLTDDDSEDTTDVLGWSWTTLQNPGSGRIIRSVAWDGDGNCLAATTGGLSFWDKTGWRDVSQDNLPNRKGIRFVRRVGAGRWVVGGDDATFATFTSEGVVDVVRLGSGSVRFDLLSGDLDDLAVLVGSAPGDPPTLCALSARRWLKPLPLPNVAAVASLTRIDDAQWLLAGRGTDGRGFAAVYLPLDWEIQPIKTPTVRAYLSCAGQWECGIGVVTGAEGAVIWAQDGRFTNERVPDDVDLSAAGVDATGRGWAAGAGQIWLRHRTGRWDRIWKNPAWSVPIISLFTDLGAVTAMTADGGIVEGRAGRQAALSR